MTRHQNRNDSIYKYRVQEEARALASKPEHEGHMQRPCSDCMLMKRSLHISGRSRVTTYKTNEHRECVIVLLTMENTGKGRQDDMEMRT